MDKHNNQMNRNPNRNRLPMNASATGVKPSYAIRFGVGVLLVVSFSLIIFYLVMRPAMSDLGLMAVFLSVTAVVSLLASYAAYLLGWMHRSPSIRWTLLGLYALSSVLTFLNVWLAARLMFTNLHDLLLATILLIFATGIAMAMGFFFSNALNDRISTLENAAHSIASGNLETRLRLSGRDEIADLAASFNHMAEQLQSTARKQKELENLRRDLIAWVSHDLQTPLASIRAIVEALADGVVEDEQTVKRYLHTAQRDIGNLSILIDDLFQMAQLEAGGLVLSCDYDSISDLISDTLESFSEYADRKRIRLQGSVAPDVDPVWMDAPRISRVLNNLVKNALEHTQSGGFVDVRANKKTHGVQVEVVDSGEGIPDDVLPLIFDRFYHAEKGRNRTKPGAGLGLAIARGIVEAHKGSISVESTYGEGARFSFFLPQTST